MSTDDFDDESDEGRPLTPNDLYQACPECGCPHSPHVLLCSFCGTELTGMATSPTAWRQTFKVLDGGIRDDAPSRKITPQPAEAVKKVGSRVGIILFGILLFAAGGWFLVTAVMGGSFADFIIGLTLASYGGYAVWTSLRPAGRR
jgi:hypothetical protein